MGRFLDQRSSMNAGTEIAVALTTPTLFGVVGLQTQAVAGPIVDLSGTIGLGTPATGTAVINVVRGTTLTDTIIYTAIITLEAAGSELVSFNAQDLLAPAALQTAYASFVSLTGGAITRVGPEAFWGIASANS
ncbi:hypothetical protein [Cohnella lupini]|uniref:Uncharacterized protein n=1 Tax=Cohnella lupini TaxID=1294267 RepID=A0A3D9IW64_9BACL|nr:hypothetical protein [Cohnella lupini]RED65945.1 hypothetical protein DFP95_101441 [Cohnella lupini]